MYITSTKSLTIHYVCTGTCVYVKVSIFPRLELLLAVVDVHVQAMTHVHVQYETSATNLGNKLSTMKKRNCLLKAPDIVIFHTLRFTSVAFQ